MNQTPSEEWAFYESGLVAHGCLENIDEYMSEAITRYGRLLLSKQRNLMSELTEGIEELARTRTYKTLVEKYPLLFERSEHSRDPFSLFGFECDLGWYDIIDCLCNSLYRNYRLVKTRLEWATTRLGEIDTHLGDYYKTKEEAEEKLTKEIESLSVEIERETHNVPIVAQIKEKFGTLRFYVDFREGISNSAAAKVYALVDFAEHMTQITCEQCGDKGKTYGIGWNKTLCHKHAVEKYGEENVAKFNKTELE